MKVAHSVLPLVFGLLLSTSALASNEFNFRGPIRVIVLFAAGGATENLARVLAPGLEKELGKTTVVENHPGTSGQIDSSYVKKAPADGSVLLLAHDHSVVVRDFTALIKDDPNSRNYGVPLIGGLPNFIGNSVGNLA